MVRSYWHVLCKSNNQPQGHKVPFVGSYYDLVSEVIILG
jgi:hypothetical protein